MNVIGTWKIKEVLKFTEDFQRVWTDVETVLANPETDESDKRMLRSKVVFGEDGFIHMVMPIPEGISQQEVDEAVASGELKRFGDNLIEYEQYEWKEENGQTMFNTGIKGEVLGEKISPWDKIEEQDGFLRFFTYHLVKEED